MFRTLLLTSLLSLSVLPASAGVSCWTELRPVQGMSEPWEVQVCGDIEDSRLTQSEQEFFDNYRHDGRTGNAGLYESSIPQGY